MDFLDRVRIITTAAETGVPLTREEVMEVLQMRRIPSRQIIGNYEVTRVGRDRYQVVERLPEIIAPPNLALSPIF